MLGGLPITSYSFCEVLPKELAFKTLLPGNELFFYQIAVHIAAIRYRVSREQLLNLGGRGILSRYPQVLQRLDPSFNWSWDAFRLKDKRAKQRWLMTTLQTLYPGTAISEEHTLDISRSTERRLTVDIFLPSKAIAFEYQGANFFIKAQKETQ
jgi:hypothetical protein